MWFVFVILLLSVCSLIFVGYRFFVSFCNEVTSDSPVKVPTIFLYIIFLLSLLFMFMGGLSVDSIDDSIRLKHRQEKSAPR